MYSELDLNVLLKQENLTESQTHADVAAPQCADPVPHQGTKTRSLNFEADPKRRLMICEAMIDLTAAYFNVSSKQLRLPGRCIQSISRVRQIAMYVSHTGLGLTMTDVGKGFCRDRTTVMHACHQIEDMRDDEDFDSVIEQFDRLSVAAFAGLLEQ